MKTAKDIYMYALGAMVVLGLFATIYLLIFVATPPVNKDALLILLGVEAAKFADVIGYFYGSSKSSAEKTEMMSGKKTE